MVRDISFALLIASSVTVVGGSYVFSVRSPTPPDMPQRLAQVYAPDDIRYPLQQAERAVWEKRQRALLIKRQRAAERQAEERLPQPAAREARPTEDTRLSFTGSTTLQE
jgi:type IV secretory pathway VirB9-like protein